MAKQNIYDNEIFLKDIRKSEIPKLMQTICSRYRLCFQ